MKIQPKELHLESMVVALMLSHPDKNLLSSQYSKISASYKELMKARGYSSLDVEKFAALMEKTLSDLWKTPEELFPAPSAPSDTINGA
jgi:hypothetical protein